MASTGSSHEPSHPLSVSLTVFDAYISSVSLLPSISVLALTNDALNDVLGFYDQLAFQVVVADTIVGTAPAALTVQIAHSADGLHYVNKNAAPEVDTPTQLNIGTPTYMSFGFDGGTAPSLGFVRLAITLTAAAGPVRAHVKITASGNNQNEQAFSRTMTKAMHSQAIASVKYVLQYGAGQKIATSAIAELVKFINDLPTVSIEQLLHQSSSNVVEARAFQLWRPILIWKNGGGFLGATVTVPPGFTIAFLGTGHYVLIEGNIGIWESRNPSAELFPRRASTLATPTVSDKSPWHSPTGKQVGPGLNTGGNPAQGVVIEKDKGK